MTNWLESEEKKKALADNEALLRAQDRVQKEELIHSNLSRFYELCNRISKLGTNSLKVSRLNVFELFQIDLPNENERYSWSDYGINIPITVRGSRGISFSASDSDQILITFYIDIVKTLTKSDDSIYLKHYPLKFRKNIFCKKCFNQDILDWQEEKMINTIRWIIYLDSFEENLPGKE